MNKCGICGNDLDGEIYSSHKSGYHAKCVISYWERLDKHKLKYRNIRDDYVNICNQILGSLEKKSLEKYGVPMEGLLEPHEFIMENIEDIRKYQLFQREIRYQESKKRTLISQKSH